MAAFLFIRAEAFVISVESHSGNIPVKLDRFWPMCVGELSFKVYFFRTTDEVQHMDTTDIDQPQKLVLSTLCSGEIKTNQIPLLLEMVRFSELR